ncbi:SGNH hydrolase-type esterase domain-containing protein [Auriculariales sp. MPI-PUGE-AT-0066]|nr:SGNH hydrolase-type esterase domain-containing protein [Auriculariales sp. MPI-PUGE-AT-0066]
MTTATPEHDANLDDGVFRGFENVDHIMIFGDSYSAVGFDSRSPLPTKKHPIGVPLPGVTYADDLNWVGYLVKSFVRSGKHSPLVYCYAEGGDTVAGVERQVVRDFLTTVGVRPEGARWTSSRSLFITWIGINDMAYGVDPVKQLERLFAAQQKLYDVGARNFVFLDVPPVYRFPCYSEEMKNSPTTKAKFDRWNGVLREKTKEFQDTHNGVTASVCSSFDIFNEILDAPETYGFKRADVDEAYSRGWQDMLHPTSALHKVIAQKIADFLYSCKVILVMPSYQR